MNPRQEDVFDQRAGYVQGVVLAYDDTGQAQTVDVQTHDGIVRTAVEVRQPFGVATAPPPVGSTVDLIAVGGDPGHYVALPPCNPSVRFGGLEPGDGGCIYAADGSRVIVRAGGLVEVLGFSKVLVQAPGVEIDAPNGCVITGPVTINGTLHVTQNLSTDAEVSAASGAISGTISAGLFDGPTSDG